MSGRVLWVVGEPGTGKTTMVRELLGPVQMLVAQPKMTRFAGGAWAAGHYTGAVFDGADTVAYNGVTPVLDFWEQVLTEELLVLDGDRFSFAGALARVRGLSVSTRCVLLSAPPAVAQARRTARGSAQAPAWLKGRVTKANGFAKLFPEADLLHVDASAPPGVVLAQVRAFLEL